MALTLLPFILKYLYLVTYALISIFSMTLTDAKYQLLKKAFIQFFEAGIVSTTPYCLLKCANRLECYIPTGWKDLPEPNILAYCIHL